MVCRKVQVARPRSEVSGGQEVRSPEAEAASAAVDEAEEAGVEVAELEPEDEPEELEEPEDEAAAPPAIATIMAIGFAALLDAESAPFFFTFILAQSCHELHTLHGLPSSPRMRPGGRFGWVSLVVRRGSLRGGVCVDIAAGVWVGGATQRVGRGRGREVGGRPGGLDEEEGGLGEEGRVGTEEEARRTDAEGQSRLV